MSDIENKKDEVVGKVKETAGKVTDNDQLEAKGKLQSAFGKIKDKAAETFDDAKDTIAEKTNEGLDTLKEKFDHKED